jgi:hypothetical protein
MSKCQGRSDVGFSMIDASLRDICFDVPEKTYMPIIFATVAEAPPRATRKNAPIALSAPSRRDILT